MRAGWCAALALAMAMTSATGCKQRSAAASSEPEATPIAVKADSEGLLLTWIDDKGDFHVETRVADVPLMGRDAVRVVDPNKDEGAHGDRVYVVDLRQARPDGTFPVRTMSRADFESLAVARREKAGLTLSSVGSPASPSAGPDTSSSARPAPRPLVIIYGAEWCGACHDAARYLKSKGIAFIEKDVEKDPGAASEMERKLAQNGLRGGSIPIIDVRGKVMVGFSAEAIDSALGQAL